jgi:hypothetical protein
MPGVCPRSVAVSLLTVVREFDSWMLTLSVETSIGRRFSDSEKACVENRKIAMYQGDFTGVILQNIPCKRLPKRWALLNIFLYI